MDIPAEWAWPLEGAELSTAYPNFLDWVQSSGAVSTDWYKTGQVPQYIWSH
jgi:LruC domain-containing protein